MQGMRDYASVGGRAPVKKRTPARLSIAGLNGIRWPIMSIEAFEMSGSKRTEAAESGFDLQSIQQRSSELKLVQGAQLGETLM
jgi:hypothetical protein